MVILIIMVCFQGEMQNSMFIFLVKNKLAKPKETFCLELCVMIILGDP